MHKAFSKFGVIDCCGGSELVSITECKEGVCKYEVYHSRWWKGFLRKMASELPKILNNVPGLRRTLRPELKNWLRETNFPGLTLWPGSGPEHPGTPREPFNYFHPVLRRAWMWQEWWYYPDFLLGLAGQALPVDGHLDSSHKGSGVIVWCWACCLSSFPIYG